MGNGGNSVAGGLRMPITEFGAWPLQGLGRFIHRTTAQTGVIHSSNLGETDAISHATVDAPRGQRGLVGPVLEAQMRNRAAAAARRVRAATAVAGVSLLLVTACNDAGTPDPTPTSSSVSSTPSAATPTASPSPTKSLNLLDPVARDQARAQRQIALGTYAAKGWVQSGIDGSSV